MQCAGKALCLKSVPLLNLLVVYLYNCASLTIFLTILCLFRREWYDLVLLAVFGLSALDFSSLFPVLSFLTSLNLGD